MLRYALENISTLLTPAKLLALSSSPLPAPNTIQILISSFIRTASFIFLSVVFVGNNWALWTGASLYLAPKLVKIITDRFPNVEVLHRFLPRGILQVTLMMFIARWWGQLLTNNINEAGKLLTYSFAFLGLPGFFTSVLGWFGRSSDHQWKQNWFTRLCGLALAVVGFLMVRDFLLG